MITFKTITFLLEPPLSNVTTSHDSRTLPHFHTFSRTLRLHPVSTPMNYSIVKRFAAFLFLFACLANAGASTMIFPLSAWNLSGTNAVTNSIKVWQVGQIVAGNGIQVGLPIWVNVTNGFGTNKFAAGNYAFSILNGAPFPYNQTLYFKSFSDTNTYYVTNSGVWISGGDFYVQQPPTSVAAGTNVTVQTNNGAFTINAAGGADTNAAHLTNAALQSFIGSIAAQGLLASSSASSNTPNIGYWTGSTNSSFQVQIGAQAHTPFFTVFDPAGGPGGTNGSIGGTQYWLSGGIMQGNASGLTNLTATNLTGVVPSANGGLGVNVGNQVATGAYYTNSTPVFGTVGAAYHVVLSAGANYYLYDPTNVSGGIEQIGVFDSTFTFGTSDNGFFNTGTATDFYIYDGDGIAVQGNPVNASLVLSNSSFLNLSGATVNAQTFNGNVTGATNIQFLNQPLRSQVGNFPTASIGDAGVIRTSNPSGDGSTLYLVRNATNGYADINFWTNNVLMFAIGAEAGTNVNIYQQPYLESYNAASDFNFVGAGRVFGGYNHAKQSFRWFNNLVTAASGNTYVSANVIFEVGSNGVTSIQGLATTGTNTYSVTSTGYTNSGTKNIQVIQFFGTSVKYSNSTSHVSYTLGNLTNTYVLKPGCSLTGTSCTAVGIEDF